MSCPRQDVPPAVDSNGNAEESQVSIPYRFRVERFFRYENPDHHEKEIQEQAKRDARDKARLRVEKDALWVGLFGLAGLLFTLRETHISTDAVGFRKDALGSYAY
jgi:hypothetical protein